MGNNSDSMIFGVRGQDGSFLAEQLLAEGQFVVGVARRASSFSNTNIEHILGHKNFRLVEGDITDQVSIMNLLKEWEPKYIYNLAAQSHVKTSFSQPTATWDATGLGHLKLLESVKLLGLDTRIYFAASSEQFGDQYSIEPHNSKLIGVDSTGVPVYELSNGKFITVEHINRFQDENTKMNPQSPYGIAKLAAFHANRLYRQAYGLFTCSGILFNHECFKYDYPFIVKYNDQINILPVQDIAEKFANFNNYGLDNKSGTLINNLEVWDNNGWTKIKCISWFKNKDKTLRIVNSRNAVYSISNDHKCILENDIETADLKLGDKIKTIEYPKINSVDNYPLQAELFGMLVGDGSISNGSTVQFTNKNKKVLERFEYLWKRIVESEVTYFPSVSGFTGEEVGRLDCKTYKNIYNDYQDDIYTKCKDVFSHKYKKIPSWILNADKDTMEAFLIGYNTCDGLKKNKCTYKFKNFKTNSPTLAAGLLFLVSQVTGQKYNITVEESWEHGKQQLYYSINLLTDKLDNLEKYKVVKNLLDKKTSQREIHRITNISRTFISKVKNGYIPSSTHHLELCNNEIKKIIEIPNYDGWFFDLETETNTLHAGIGQGLVHNSERRPEMFLTRKITRWIGRYIGNSKMPALQLGNLYSSRDWGYSGDYTKIMRMIIEHKVADDFVVGTGTTHTVYDFLIDAFKCAGIKEDAINSLVKVNDDLKRPAEVQYLCSAPLKAQTTFNIDLSKSYDKMVEKMVESDLALAEKEAKI